MARKKTTSTPQPVEAESGSQAATGSEPDSGFETHGLMGPGRKHRRKAIGKRGVTSKTDAVRRALAAGKEGPQEGTAWIRQALGVEMTPQHFSAVKSQIKKREGGATGEGRPGRKPKAAVEGYLAPPPGPLSGGGPDLLAAMEAMKPLVEALGADKVKRIADLLG
jgi:hypothetical protein